MKALLIGTGRLAFHLGPALRHAGIDVTGIVGRDRSKAHVLASRTSSQAFALGDELPSSDIRIIAVRDDAIAEVAAILPKVSALTVHTSGAQHWEILGDHGHRGVLWPLQSFGPGGPVDLSSTPLVIDAEDDGSRMLLKQLAQRSSRTVIELAHHQREQVHIAAVLASNFPVFLLAEAGRLLQRNGLDPQLLLPIWRTTTERASATDPVEALTGPARRGDMRTLRAHLDRLTSDPDLHRAYAVLSTMILKAYGHPTDGLEDLQGDPR